MGIVDMGSCRPDIGNVVMVGAGKESADSSDLLFVYGTLRKGCGQHPATCLAEEAELIGVGRFQGRLYEASGYPGAVPSKNKDEQVLGDVYRLRNPDKLLPRLDAYEGCGPGDTEPREYVRRKVVVRLQNNRKLRAWIYLYNLPVDGLMRIVSGDYLKFKDCRGKADR